MSLTKLTHKKADLSAVDKAKDIGEVSQKGTETLMAELERYLPGFGEMTGSAASLAKDWMAGKMHNPEVLARRANERAINLGFTPGTQFTGFGELRDYGVNVMAMQQQGATLAQQLQAQAQQGVSQFVPKPEHTTVSAQGMLGFAQGEADRAMEIDSFNMARQDQRDAIAREEETRNRISRISAQNAAQRMSFSSPSRGSVFQGFGTRTNPLAYSNPYSVTGRQNPLAGFRSHPGSVTYAAQPKKAPKGNTLMRQSIDSSSGSSGGDYYASRGLYR